VSLNSEERRCFPPTGREHALISLRCGAIVLVTGFVAVYIAVSILDPHLSPGSPSLFGILNTLPPYLALIFAWSVTRRIILSGLAVGSGLVFLFLVNHLKLQELSDIVIPSDLYLAGQVAANLDFFVRYTSASLLLLLGLMALGVMGTLLLRRETPAEYLTPLSRIVLGGICAALALSFLSPTAPTAQIYSAASLGTDPRPKTSARQVGLIATLIKMTGELRTPLPAYDKDVIRRFEKYHWARIAAHQGVTPPDTFPDIVVVMSESFFDPSILQGIDDVPQMAAFREIAAAHTTGDLAVPAGVGGGTMRSEFEFLTGFSLRHLTRHPYPYFSLVRGSFPGLPWILRDQGYETIAMHPFRASFWNRYNAYPQLGFGRFYAEEYFPPIRDGFFVSDSIFIDAVTAKLVNDHAQFIFAVSMEGHGPWAERDVLDGARRDAIAVPWEMDEAARTEFQTFLYHLENADRALHRLYNKVMARSRPTILLFFGDHLPFLPETFRSIEFENGLSSAQQSVPFLIASNRAPASRRVNTCSHFLGSLLLDMAGIPMPDYLARIAVISSKSTSFASREDGLVCALPDEVREAHRHVQASFLSHDRRGFSSAVTP
jgi:hypothetical protein